MEILDVQSLKEPSHWFQKLHGPLGFFRVKKFQPPTMPPGSMDTSLVSDPINQEPFCSTPGGLRHVLLVVAPGLATTSASGGVCAHVCVCVWVGVGVGVGAGVGVGVGVCVCVSVGISVCVCGCENGSRNVASFSEVKSVPNLKHTKLQNTSFAYRRDALSMIETFLQELPRPR